MKFFVDAGASFAGDDGVKWNDGSVLQVGLEFSTCREEFIEPPGGVSVGIDWSRALSLPLLSTLVLKQVARPSLSHWGQIKLRRFAVELVDGLVEHPVGGVDLFGGVVGVAAARAIKGFGPTYTRVAAPEFRPIFVKFHPEFGMRSGHLGKRTEEVRVGQKEHLGDFADFADLVGRGGRVNRVMPGGIQSWLRRPAGPPPEPVSDESQQEGEVTKQT